MQMLWASTLVGLVLVVAGLFVAQPWITVLVASGAFLFLGGLISLLIRPFTRPGAVIFDEGGDGHGHGGGGHH